MANVRLNTNGYTANFANAGVANGIGVTVSGLTLSGTAATNYTLTQPAGLTANITAVGVTISSGLSANNKPYDGTTTATISSNNVVLSGVLPGDAANVRLNTNGYTANFANAGVANGIGVTVSGMTLSGTAATNYTLTQPAGLTANITAVGVTISSGMSANNKPYDGTTRATISFEQRGIERGIAGRRGERAVEHQRLYGELCQCGSSQWHRGDGKRPDVERDGGDQLHIDAAGRIDGEHHGGGGDDYFGD